MCFFLVKEVVKTMEQKKKDLYLCKDADLVSFGRGSTRNKSNPASAASIQEDDVYRPHDMFSSLKQLLEKQGRNKDVNNDSFNSKSTEIDKHSTPKTESFEKQTNKINKSVDSNNECGSDDFSKTEHSNEINEQLQQKQYSNIQQQRTHQNHQNKQFQSQDEQKEQQNKEQEPDQTLSSYTGKNRNQKEKGNNFNITLPC